MTPRSVSLAITAVAIAGLVGCGATGATRKTDGTGPTGGTYHLVAGLPGAAGSAIESVAHGAGGYVAVGLAPSDTGGAWTSTDGSTWTAAPTVAALAGLEPVVVRATATGYVMVANTATRLGAEEGDFLPFTSVDGRTWTAADANGILFGGRDVVVGGPGLVSVGFALLDAASARYDGRIATSRDGTSWTGVAADPVFDHTRVNAVAALGPQLVAVGRTSEGLLKGLVWTSSDGTTWKRVPDTAAFDGSSINGVVATSSGLVAVGGFGDKPAVWTSQDGMTWREVADASSLGDGVISAVAAGPAGLVAVGDGQAGSVVWTSTDGSRWTRAPGQPDFEGAQMLGVIADPRVVIVGRAAPGTSPTGLIWAAP